MKFLGDISATDWRRPSVIALILANLVPVFGVFFFGWEVFPLIFLFWSENVIVGVFNVLRMFFALPYRVGVLPMIPFFCVHYGMFTFVHGVFVVGLFGGGFKPGAPFPDAGVFWRIIQENHLGWAVLGLAISRGISFATNYVGQGEFRRITPSQLMSQPCGRIVVLHIAILGGGFLVMALHSPLLGLLLLVALKIALDLRGHFAERRKFAATETVKRTDVVVAPASRGSNSASRRIASAGAQRRRRRQVKKAALAVFGFGRDARNNPRDAGATHSIRVSLRLQPREQDSIAYAFPGEPPASI